MTSSESEGQAPSKKRSRTGDNEETGSKKARGRPRVDTQDATAADRRRTQIRLAQRAYRQRKETTISSLKQQNNELQSIIEEMNKSFLHFNDTALQSGLIQTDPNLVHELKRVTEQFVNLAKTAAAERSNDGDEESTEAGLDPSLELQKAATSARASLPQPKKHDPSPIPLAMHTDVGWGYSATLATGSPEPSGSPRKGSFNHSTYFPSMSNSTYEATVGQNTLISMRSNSINVGQALDQSINNRGVTSELNHLPFGLMDIQSDQSDSSSNAQIYRVHVPAPEITPPLTSISDSPHLSSISTKSPTPIWTYSHQETTFARRLTRSALESGFHLLSSASARPAAVNFVFKLSLPYMTVDRIREKFRLMLARGTDEDLDSFDTPFIHLGGAGTHYPRKDVHGNIVPIPNSWTVRKIGPMKRIRAQNVVDASLSHELDIDLTGFEGEWFDAHDVEGYLKEGKGCHINPQDTFAEVFVDVDDDPLPGLGDLLHAKNAASTLELPELHPSTTSQSPSLSHSSSISTDNLSSSSTPGSNISDPFSGIGRAQTVRTEEPFGLDMGMNMNPFADLNSKINHLDNSAFFEQPLGLDLAPGFDFGQENNSIVNFNTSGFGDISNFGLDMIGTGSGALPMAKPKSKKAAWVDVSKLVEELIKHAVCLGRAPGFRRKDVDMAFKASLIHF